jgi:flavodoxin
MGFITQVKWGRLVTEEEQATVQAKIEELNSNNIYQTGVSADPTTGIGSRTWETEEAANNWVAFVNTFTPPPRQAIVVTE